MCTHPRETGGARCGRRYSRKQANRSPGGRQDETAEKRRRAMEAGLRTVRPGLPGVAKPASGKAREWQSPRVAKPASGMARGAVLPGERFRR
ncbi:hypothetical protein Aca07nite_26180 [Actinoplanes capillaceus]|uniref:Uncharacterized protein n=1 Tax=Actinoplanes campanulatus TaxID=113559 RepID=A0ABQ3WGG3_9ACTN|nr:hypothetical protein Aca07nite_26180 [Actinoplanes capillaceus]